MLCSSLLIALPDSDRVIASKNCCKRSHTFCGSNLNFYDMSVINGDLKKEALKPKFVAPDGGWGWMIVIASGLSNFFIYGFLLCFGMIFRDRLDQLGINASQISTIMNVNCAVRSCIGLANGPLFRVYNYRQVSLAGALISSLSICALFYMETFWGLLIFFSIMYGSGVGLAMSAGILALNTYFEKRRRLAVGLTWTLAGIGPMISPQIVALLMPIYGSTGTCLLFGGISFNMVACALLMRPIDIHVSKKPASGGMEVAATVDAENVKDSSNDVFIRKSNEVNDNQSLVAYLDNIPVQILIKDDPRECLDSNSKPEDEEAMDLMNTVESSSQTRKTIPKEKVKSSWHHRLFHGIIVYFDLDLLQDPVYMNLMMGINMSNFVEFNFIFLYPYILFEYDLTESRIAATLSVIAAVDLVMRLLIPYVTTRFALHNNTYFLIGVGSAAIGRFVLAHVEMYSVIITMAVLMGIGRAFTIIFQFIVIPTHVPLERLPAATGLQMMTGGVIFLMLGPVVGLIRDTTGNYTMVLHFMGFFSCLIIISWVLQAWGSSTKRDQL